ncbi:UPF0280 family protein [Allorhizobium terrae]|uniref:UPF0280 family protein n=2 Tax=Allorhizobium terrae TaxID=1848972 RepID=A0A4S3ZUR1_9HYPH|nr:UPF0280 family protein [Allorhizobium terrae]
MNGSIAASYLDGDRNGRLHLQHGPIDLVIGVGDHDRVGNAGVERQRALAFQVAYARFATVLEELVGELSLLKMPHGATNPRPSSPIAQRMVDAVTHFSNHHFITPMAAVAGSVADEIVSAILVACQGDDRPSRLYVNNGGDIALHLASKEAFEIGIADESGSALGRFQVSGQEPNRGIATSGRGGRSLSMGIADSVTVIARSAAMADAAATLIGNAVDLPGHAAIARAAANSIKDDSDLGERLVVTACGALNDDDIAQALDAGEVLARHFMAKGLVARCALFLKGRSRIVTPNPIPMLSSKATAFIPEERHYA